MEDSALTLGRNRQAEVAICRVRKRQKLLSYRKRQSWQAVEGGEPSVGLNSDKGLLFCLGFPITTTRHQEEIEGKPLIQDCRD